MVCGCVIRLWPFVVWIRFQKDPTWSETGDRYLLKLFRDHLFHQVTEAGTPWIDLSHIVSCLNKVSQVSYVLFLFQLCKVAYFQNICFWLHIHWLKKHAGTTDCRTETIKVGLLLAYFISDIWYLFTSWSCAAAAEMISQHFYTSLLDTYMHTYSMYSTNYKPYLIFQIQII